MIRIFSEFFPQSYEKFFIPLNKHSAFRILKRTALYARHGPRASEFEKLCYCSKNLFEK
jgi:hypothetical protein